MPSRVIKIAPFDQEEAEVAGKIGLLEIGLVKRAGGQKTDARVRPLRHRGKAEAESFEEWGKPLDIYVTVEVGESARQDQPIGERIAGT